MKELIIQNPFAAPRDPSIANQPKTSTRISRRPSGLSPVPERDDGLSSQKGRTNPPRLSGDFSFNVPHLQIQGGERKGRDRRNKDTDDPLLPLALATSPAEAHGVVHRAAPLLRTPIYDPPQKTFFFTDHNNAARTPHQSTAFQRSGVHKGPSENLLSYGNRDSNTAHTPSMVLEGSSPTLHASRSLSRVSRSLGYIPTNSQGMFCAWCDPGGDNILPGTSNDRFLRPNAGLAGVHRTGDVDPLTLGEGASPSQPSRHIRRTGSTKSLPDGRRRNNGAMPTSIRGKSRLNP